MAFLEKLSEFGNIRSAAIAKTTDAQHELVLLWGHAALSSCFLAKTKEFAERIAELRKIAHDQFDLGLD
jgi:hypothetical protein